MDEEFKSFLVTDPDILDEGIDVSGIRQATEQDKLIAGAIAEEPGLAYDPRLTSYLSDLNRYFSGGFPTISTPPTTTPTPPIEDPGSDGGSGPRGRGDEVGIGDPGTDGGSGPRGRLTESGTFGGQPTFTTTPGTTVDNITGDITNPDGTYGGNLIDDVALTGGTTAPQTGFLASGAAGGASLANLDLDNIDLGNPTGDSRVVSEEQGLSGKPGMLGDTGGSMDQMSGAQQNIDGLTTPQSNQLKDIASKVGGDLVQFGQEIASIPGAVYDSLTNTVEVFGEKFNIGKTAAGLVMNKLAGGPISLVFAVGDVLSNILPEPSIQSKTAAIVGIQDPENPGKDIFGKNIDSAFGDYDLMNKQQISNLTDQLTKNATKYGVTVDVNPVTGELEVIGPPTNVSSYNYANAYMLNELDKRTEYDDARSMSDIGQQTITGPNIDEEEGRPDDIPDRGRGDPLKDAISGDIGVEGEDEGRFTDRGMKDQSGRDTSPTDIPDRGMGITEGQLKSQLDQSGEQIGTLKELEEMEDLYATGTNIMRDFDFDQGGGGDGPPSSGFSAPSKQGQSPRGSTTGVGGGADMGSVSTAGQAGPPSQRGDGGGGGGGGGKIVCTMMNESYGFGSFRNKIWLRHSKNLAPEYQKGYHKIFLPLVKLSKKNIVLKKVLEHIAIHRTIDIRQESRGKVHLLGRLYRKILEPICYWVGKYVK
jgi:hypothetical protein